jgi:antitoxin component YwqK of YwqJK toxin-antitoxin module
MGKALPPVEPATPVVLEQHDEQGVLQNRTELLDGVPHGQMTAYGPGGKPSMQAAYRAGVLHGTVKLWDDEGLLVQEAVHHQGKQQGLTRVYSGGRLLSEQMFAQGKLHGETVFYSEAGVPTCKMQFKQGQVEGEALFFNEGSLVRRAVYRKGLLEGEAIDYDREGTKVQSAHYKANLLEGWLRRYWPNGQVMEETQYKQGKPVAKPRRFNSKGAKQAGEEAQASLMQRLEKLVRG